MSKLTLAEAFALTGDAAGNPDVWVSSSERTPEDFIPCMKPSAALEKYDGYTVTRIQPCISDDGRYLGNIYDVAPDRPEIVVCVEGGIVQNVYVKNLPENAGLVILDVDSDRADADPIEKEWNRIARDPSYTSLDTVFYAPLDEDGNDA